MKHPSLLRVAHTLLAFKQAQLDHARARLAQSAEVLDECTAALQQHRDTWHTHSQRAGAATQRGSMFHIDSHLLAMRHVGQLASQVDHAQSALHQRQQVHDGLVDGVQQRDQEREGLQSHADALRREQEALALRAERAQQDELWLLTRGVRTWW